MAASQNSQEYFTHHSVQVQLLTVLVAAVLWRRVLIFAGVVRNALRNLIIEIESVLTQKFQAFWTACERGLRKHSEHILQ